MCTHAFLSVVPTVQVMNIDLNAPIWAIDHLAAALGVSIDTAREHTYSLTFPAARAGFSRNLWLREDVLTWFASLPAKDRDSSTRRNHASRFARGATAATAPVETAKALTKPN